MYLAELLSQNLPDAEVHHEILDFGSFGVDTPEISHLHEFNCLGNTAKVQEFWQQKFGRILQCGKECYVETSHVLMKAGLVENAVTLAQEHEVRFIILTRDYVETLISYHDRGDFTEAGNRWLWYLDPEYQRVLINPEPFCECRHHGVRLWYLNEIYTRASLYRAKHGDRPNVLFHEFDIAELNDVEGAGRLLGALGEAVPKADLKIPERQNARSGASIATDEERDLLRALVESGKIDPVEAAERALRKHPEPPGSIPEKASVIWSAPLLESGAEADDSRALVIGVDGPDFRVKADPVKVSSQLEELPSEQCRSLERMSQRPLQSAFIHVQHVPPCFYQLTPDATANIGRGSCGVDRIPPDWAAKCDAMDEVWAPSDHEIEVFAFSGVDRSRLHKVPACIDVEGFGSHVTPVTLAAPQSWTFLSVLEWGPQSGWDLLLHAYAEEFSADEDVVLLLKLLLPPDMTDQQAAEEIRSHLKDTLGLPGPIPRLDLHLDPVCPGLYRACDAFVLPSRSGGLGRRAMEAMASGLPVVATGWGGHTEFINRQNSWLIDYALVDVPDSVWAEMPHLEGSRWAEPSGEHLRSLMREVFENRDEARERGRIARKHIRANYSQEQVAEQVSDRLGEFLGDRLSGEEGPSEPDTLEAPVSGRRDHISIEK